jgi:hypothetical protein
MSSSPPAAVDPETETKAGGPSFKDQMRDATPEPSPAARNEMRNATPEPSPAARKEEDEEEQEEQPSPLDFISRTHWLKKSSDSA